MSIQFQSKYLRETQVKEMLGTGGAVGAPGEAPSANFKSGTGMEYTTKTKKVEEDAPMLAHGKANIKTYTQDGFKKTKRGTSGMTGVIVKDLWEDRLEELMPAETYEKAMDKLAQLKDSTTWEDRALYNRILDLILDYDTVSPEDREETLKEAHNYHQFKKEAQTRTKPQQMHEAAKMINKKLEEVNRLLEYTNQMRSELSEGENQTEYSHNTKKLFEKINTKVVEAYTKLKKVK